MPAGAPLRSTTINRPVIARRRVGMSAARRTIELAELDGDRTWPLGRAKLDAEVPQHVVRRWTSLLKDAVTAPHDVSETADHYSLTTATNAATVGESRPRARDAACQTGHDTPPVVPFAASPPGRITMADNADAAPAILQRDVGARLDAIVRRHGGHPKPTPTPGVHVPNVGRRKCKDQIPLDLGTDDAASE